MKYLRFHLVAYERRYVAKCKLCGWQWAVASGDRALAEKGCPACGAGENMVVVEEEGNE
jgi:rubredoxin